jgi:hypothetical protein
MYGDVMYEIVTFLSIDKIFYLPTEFNYMLYLYFNININRHAYFHSKIGLLLTAAFLCGNFELCFNL